MYGLIDGSFFFFSERKAIGVTGYHGFGVDAGAFPRVKRGEDYAGILAIEERDRKALIPAGFLEGIEAEHAGLVDAFEPQFPQAVRNLEEFLDFVIELLGFVELVNQDFFKIGSVFAGEKYGEFLF